MLHAAIDTGTKSPQAFRTISEVADGLDVPQHVLRFWESRFAQVRPVKRAGGRRYYRPEDIDLLRGIQKLLYGEGMTIKGVQKILRERGARYVAEVGRGYSPPHGRARNGEAPAFETVFVAPPAPPAPIARTHVHAAASAPPPREGLSEQARAKLEMRLEELLDLKRRLCEAAGRAN
jgi:DNA-binding transcriptional MerR regulator